VQRDHSPRDRRDRALPECADKHWAWSSTCSRAAASGYRAFQRSRPASASDARASAARRTCSKLQRRWIRTLTCIPREPEVLGQPRSPCSSRTSRTSSVARARPREQQMVEGGTPWGLPRLPASSLRWGTGGSQTHPWRELDSNFRSPVAKTVIEGASRHGSRTGCSNPRPWQWETEGSNPFPSREESANHRFLSPHACLHESRPFGKPQFIGKLTDIAPSVTARQASQRVTSREAFIPGPRTWPKPRRSTAPPSFSGSSRTASR
jgi:hypothetical protein